MTKTQRRLVRAHRRALAAWTSRQGYGFDARPEPMRILLLHALLPCHEPGDTLGVVYPWWN